MVVLPPYLRCRGCYPGSLSGTCWLALVALLCLWTPGSCGVPSLHVRSPVSGPDCVLPQSTIVTLLSLLWLGLLLVFVRFHYLRPKLWASAYVGPHGCPAFSRVGAVPSNWVPLLSLLIANEGFHWRRCFFLGGGDGSLPFRSGVVVSLRPLSICLGS